MQQTTIRVTFGSEDFPPRQERHLFSSADGDEVPLRCTPDDYCSCYSVDWLDAHLHVGKMYWLVITGYCGYVVVERGSPTHEGPWSGEEILDVGGTIEYGQMVIKGDPQGIAEMPLAARARVEKKELRYLVRNNDEERAALVQLGITL